MILIILVYERIISLGEVIEQKSKDALLLQDQRIEAKGTEQPPKVRHRIFLRVLFETVLQKG